MTNNRYKQTLINDAKARLPLIERRIKELEGELEEVNSDLLENKEAQQDILAFILELTHKGV